ARQAADAERQIDRQRPGRDDVHLGDLVAAEAHDRSIAELLLDDLDRLGDRAVLAGGLGFAHLGAPFASRRAASARSRAPIARAVPPQAPVCPWRAVRPAGRPSASPDTPVRCPGHRRAHRASSAEPSRAEPRAAAYSADPPPPTVSSTGAAAAAAGASPAASS